MSKIELVCADCARLAKCKSAPDSADALLTFSCDDWYPLHSAIVSARQNIYKRFGAASRDGFRKKERAMQPDRIINAVNTGDIESIEALRTQDVNPVNLMLAAAQVDKSAGGAIAEEYRALAGDDEARRNMLIDKLVANAKSVEEKPAPKKRRSRRKKVVAETQPELPTESPADIAAKEAQKAEFIKQQQSETNNEQQSEAGALVVQVHEGEVLKALQAQTKLIIDLGAKVEVIQHEIIAIKGNSTAGARYVETVAEEVGKIKRNMARAKAGLTDFEVELIGSGTIGSAPFLNSTEGWED